MSALEMEDFPPPPARISTKPKSSVIFYDGQFKTIANSNSIVRRILESGYDLPTKVVVSEMYGMHDMFPRNEVNINLEMWRTHMEDWVVTKVRENKIVDLGPIYMESGDGFYVPRYVVEGDAERGIEPVAPDLKSIFDLKKYGNLFTGREDTRRSFWIGGIKEWGAWNICRIKMSTYGLDDQFDCFTPQTPDEFNEKILSTYHAGKPFVTYYWYPSPMMGLVDLVRLEEPPFERSVQLAMESKLKNYSPGEKLDRACEAEVVPNFKFANSQFAAQYPDIISLVRSVVMPTSIVSELAAYQVGNRVSADVTADFFFKKYPEVWRKWIPDSVANRVGDAL